MVVIARCACIEEQVFSWSCSFLLQWDHLCPELKKKHILVEVTIQFSESGKIWLVEGDGMEHDWLRAAIAHEDGKHYMQPFRWTLILLGDFDLEEILLNL